jgi:hypothetical protein
VVVVGVEISDGGGSWDQMASQTGTTINVLSEWHRRPCFAYSPLPCWASLMAENIYSKGTRVWFEDKEHAWMSAEVASVTKADNDNIKLVFIDERGKVSNPSVCMQASL